MYLPIILFDKSCKRFARECQKIYKGQNVVVAIGGGTVIDKAKILALPNRCIAYPTTASGAAMTSHAVVWTKDAKLSIPTPKPIYKKYPYKINLASKVAFETFNDALAHCIDSRHSYKATKKSRELVKKALHILIKRNNKDLVKAGNYAGQAIDITGTGLIHQLSYPLTIFNKVPHGLACRKIMEWLIDS